MQLPIPFFACISADLDDLAVWLLHIYPMDKGSVQWIALKTEWVVSYSFVHVTLWWRQDNLPLDCYWATWCL